MLVGETFEEASVLLWVGGRAMAARIDENKEHS